MRLCFGTFAQVLKCCRINESVSNMLLVETIIETIDSGSRYGYKYYQVSKLISCKTNFSSGIIKSRHGDTKVRINLSNIRQLASKVAKEDVVQNFEENVIPLISEEKKKLVVLSLLDIIKQDNIIEKNYNLSFEKYVGIKKSELLNQHKFVLADFLAGLLLYIINMVENKVGVDCIEEITEDYVLSFAYKRYAIQIWDSASQKPKIVEEDVASPVTDESKNVTQNEDISQQMVEIFKSIITENCIADYLGRSPDGLINPVLPEKIPSFRLDIEHKIISPFLSIQEEIKYQKITAFSKLLNRYNEYLMSNLSLNFNGFYVPLMRDGKMNWILAFKRNANRLRERLHLLYGEICDGEELFTLTPHVI